MNVSVISNVATMQLIADYEKKTQHLWRCSTQTIRKPRVAYTIVWQPWAIKSAIPTALIRAFCNIIFIVSCNKKQQSMHLFTPTHFTFYYQQHHLPQLTLKQFPPFPWLTTPLSLRRGVGGEALFALHHFTLYYQPRHPHNYFTMQLGTSCSFDSPGLARNEPTPGKHLHGDSTP